MLIKCTEKEEIQITTCLCVEVFLPDQTQTDEISKCDSFFNVEKCKKCYENHNINFEIVEV